MNGIMRVITLVVIAGALVSAARHLGDIAATLKSHKPACAVQQAPKMKGMV